MNIPRVRYRSAKGTFTKGPANAVSREIILRPGAKAIVERVTPADKGLATKRRKRGLLPPGEVEHIASARVSAKSWRLLDAYSAAGLGRALRNPKGDLKISVRWHHHGEKPEESGLIRVMDGDFLKGLGWEERRNLVVGALLQEIRGLGVQTTRRRVKGKGLVHARIDFHWVGHGRRLTGANASRSPRGGGRNKNDSKKRGRDAKRSKPRQRSQRRKKM